MVHIGSYRKLSFCIIYSNVLCHKKYLQYVTFYYIKKYCVKFSSAW